MGAQRRVHGLPVALARLRGAGEAGRSPLAGYAPVGGAFLVTLAIAAVAAALALLVDALAAAARTRAALLLAAMAAVLAGGAALARVEWTVPSGTPVAVSLVQGNVTQELKFDPDFRRTTFDLYLRLVDASRGRLVVLPESAFPVFADEVPEGVLQQVRDIVAARDGDALVGLFTVEPPLAPGGGLRYYNSVVSAGANRPQLYRKRHLVPFGETIPLEPVVGWFIRSVLSIPLASQASGDPDPPALHVAGQRVAVNICYEDAFGAEIRRQAGDATLLVNVTNDAWYGRSLAAYQHNQIAGDARARDRPPAAARDEYGNHVGDRPRRPRDRAPALVHARRARGRGHGPRRGRRPTCAGATPSPTPLPCAFRHRDRCAPAAPENTPLDSIRPPVGAMPVKCAMPDRPMSASMPTFQQIILRLQDYWDRQGCALLQPYDMEVGAGTSHTATFLRALGPEPWRAAYVQPSRRPQDGRYGENPNRMQHYYQFQVVLKPSPADILDRYLGSLAALGFDLAQNDVRFVEDDWENPTLGAWGLGWEVWLNGMEVTQFTYFQQVGGIDCNPITGEITYGLERLAMYLQGKENVFDLVWTESSEGGTRRSSPTATSTIRTRSSSPPTTSSSRMRRSSSSCSRSSSPRPSGCWRRGWRCPVTR